MLPDALVEETLFSSSSDPLEFQSNSLECGSSRSSALFPAGIFETNYGRTIRLLLDPQRAPLQWNQTSSFIQQPLVVMMMTRGRMSHADQGPLPDSSSSSLQETGSLSQQGTRSELKKRPSKVSIFALNRTMRTNIARYDGAKTRRCPITRSITIMRIILSIVVI